MLRLLAIAKEDGWAYVRSDRKIYLVRPPYTREVRSEADSRSVEKAITLYGFWGQEQDFADWESLISFLVQTVRATHQVNVQPVGSELGHQFLLLASREDLGEFLDRVEHELMPARQWEHASRLLLAMLKIPKVCSEQALVQRAAALLERAIAQKGQVESRIVEESQDSLSPRASRRFGSKITVLEQKIVNRHSMWC